MLALLAAATLAPFPYRWFYVQTNFFREEAVQEVEALLPRAAKAGYNGLVFTDTKLQSQDPVPDFFRARINKLTTDARKLGIDVIPSVLPIGYADGMLSHDPNLVEAIGVKDQPFVVHGKEANVELPSELILKNGDFEAAQGDRLSDYGFQDGIGISSFVDHEVVHGGKASLRIQDPQKLTDVGGNCRVMQRVKVRPNSHYEFSAWVKSANFQSAGSVRLLVLGQDGKALSFHEIGLEQTQDWKQAKVTFDTFANQEVNLYMGVWGGTTGKLWFDDAQCTPLGLTNLVRRAGCPTQVKTASGRTLVEGKDYEALKDPDAGIHPWPGEFDVSHPSPPIRLLPASGLRDGDRILVSFYHAASTEMGKTAICPSEPKSQQLEAAEIQRVMSLFGGKRVFFAHDEIRVLNQCAACQARNLSAGDLLADDVRRATNLANKVVPGCERFIWSDMFDPNHNAVSNYYLVNGDLTGAWKGLDRDMVVVNWNSGQPEKSLAFFDGLGNRQILAGYYDGPVESIKDWIAKGKGKRIVGVMYTTWVNDYRNLEAFAKAAWGYEKAPGPLLVRAP